MKKKMVYLKEFVNLQAIKRRVANAFSEKGQEAADAIRALIDELESAEVEVDENTLAEKIQEVLANAEPNTKTEEAIANAIAKRMQAITDTVGAKNLSAAVKNQISAAILRAGSKEEVKNAVNAVLVKNDVSGFTFEEVVDYAVVENWGNLNPIFSKLHKTFFTKFFYNSQDVKTAILLAKQWDKTGETEKKIQEIAVTGKTISTRYIYKRQQAAQEDLDEIEKAGGLTNFLRFVNEELDRMIVNTIVMAILVGDTVNDLADRVTTFETIGSKASSDVFTTVITAAGAVPTLQEARATADAVKNPNGKEKVAIVSTAHISNLAEFKYSGTGSVMYRSTDDIAKQLGVDVIIPCDLFEGTNVLMVVMLPDGYWYNEKKAISVAYPKYEENIMNYQKERNIGGAIHDLFSTAVLKKA